MSPSTERGISRDRRQNTSVDAGVRSSVPMWDSSDPNRAPPPLPLRPDHPSMTSPTKGNVSSTVAAAAQALIENARENLRSSYTTNHFPERSPERSPTKTPQHKRLQSLQGGVARSIENLNQSERASRPTTPLSSISTDIFTSSPEASPSREGSVTPVAPLRDTVRSTTRAPLRSILGDYTPPQSSTMLALANMPIRDTTSLSFSDSASEASPKAASQNIDGINSQIANLTSIASTLQKEMAALSRRSKDNAVDLNDLREVAGSRDEDIRKALQEVLHCVRNPDNSFLSPSRRDQARSATSMGHSPKAVSLPRIPPLHSTDEYERAVSPSPFSAEGTASIAMLDKIFREMSTKEGTDRLSDMLVKLLDRPAASSSQTPPPKPDIDAAQVLGNIEKLVESIKEHQSETSANLALVKHNGTRRASDSTVAPHGYDLTFEHGVVETKPGLQLQRGVSIASAFVNDDMVKLMQKIKESVAQGGGMTGEIKSLVRELRGEVLGMGRDIGHKIQKLQVDKSTSDSSQQVSRMEVEQIVRDGLAELKGVIDQAAVVRRRESLGSITSHTSINSEEVYAIVKQALAEHNLAPVQTVQPYGSQSSIDKESIVAAVREAYETNQPEINLEFPTEEILQSLREGLEEYHASKPANLDLSISREEIMSAVHDAMSDFQPAGIMSSMNDMKQELLATVRESLDHIQQSEQRSRSMSGGEIGRDDILDTLRQGLGDFRREGAREIEISPDDLFAAVKAGLEQTQVPYGEKVLNSLHDIIEGMRGEFKQYSEANGRDTEQVLDALKDGLESLRSEVETYVDRAQDVTGKDEIIDSIRAGVEDLRRSFEEVSAQAAHSTDPPTGNSAELLEYVKVEFEQLHEAIGSQNANREPHSSSIDQVTLLETIQEGFNQLRQQQANADATSSISDEHLETMRSGFDRLHDAIQTQPATRDLEDSHNPHHTSLLAAISEGFLQLKENQSSSRGLDDMDDERLDALKAEFEQLREAILAGSAAQKDELLDAIQDGIGSLHAKVNASDAGTDNSYELLNTMRDEFASLRDSMAAPVLASASKVPDVDDMIRPLRQTLDDIRVQISSDQSEANDEALGLMKEELEAFRETIAGSLTVSNNDYANDEVLEALRNGLDGLKNQIDEKLGSALVPAVNNDSERLSTMQEGLEQIRADLSKAVNKPTDMTVSYEILDTLKAGISTLRNDIDQIKSDTKVVLAEDPANHGAQSTSLRTTDLEGLEVMVTQLQIKIEAMSETLQGGPLPSSGAGNASKDDLDNIETLLRSVQGAVDELAHRELPHHSSLKPEDAEALETVVINAKVKIDDTVVPLLEAAATREQLEGVETIARMTSEAVDSLLERIGDGTAKDQLASLEQLMRETSTSLEEIKTRVNDEGSREVTKGDLEIVGILCTEIKTKLNDLAETGAMASKEDVSELRRIVQELKDSHETDIGVTAKAFDDRKEAEEGVIAELSELKTLVEESKEELRARLKRGSADVRAIDEILVNIEEKIEAVPVAATTIIELQDTIKSEFERALTTMELLKTENGDQASTILERTEQQRMTLFEELSQKLDLHFADVQEKHEEQRKHAEDASQALRNSASQQEDLLEGSKAMAEELKVTIDTLGTAITSITPALEETTEKLAADARTVFDRVEDMHVRLGDAITDSKTDHQFTRDEIAKTLIAVGGVQQEMTDYHPQFMMILRSLLAVTEQHFEHSKGQAPINPEDIKAHFDEGFKRIPVPQIEAPPPAPPTAEKFDDTQLNMKLDILLEQVRSPPHLEKIEQIHQQVMRSAEEVSAFVAQQSETLRITHENKEREADQAALELSKCLNEKELLDGRISEMERQKQSLAADIKSLNEEREQLVADKMRLHGDVSALEAALNIRREELHAMDARADALERRIIDGVLDHSRALLIAKAPRQPPPNLSLKRVSSRNSNVSNMTATPSGVGSMVDMAVKARPALRRNAENQNSATRRILSLSQITGNAVNRSKTVTTAPHIPKGGLKNLKRSQSVRQPQGRESPWNGSTPGDVDGADDKENGASDVEDDTSNQIQYDEMSNVEGMTPATDRRMSYGAGQSEYSYFTGSEVDRRTSYGSVVRSSVGGLRSGLDGSIHEDDEEDDGDSVDGSIIHSEVGARRLEGLSSSDFEHDEKRLVLHGGRDKDSGLGSEVPTASFNGTAVGSDYFRKE